MARQISFEFDELPLVIEGGFEAGLVAGSADISYHPDGEWSVTAIYLDGCRERTPAERAVMRASGLQPTFFEHKPVEIDAGSPLFNMILDRLEDEWRDKVEAAVADEIAADREYAADDDADFRRDLRKHEAA